MALETITVNGTTYRLDFGGLVNVPGAGTLVAGIAKYDGTTITKNADGQICADGIVDNTVFVPETDASDLTFSDGEADIACVNFPIQGQAVRVTTDGVDHVVTCIPETSMTNESRTDDRRWEYLRSIVRADGFSVVFSEDSATVVLDQAGTVPFETLSVRSASIVPMSMHPRLRNADMVRVAGATTGQSPVQTQASFTADVAAGMTTVVLVDGNAYVTDVALIWDDELVEKSGYYIGCALDQSGNPDYVSAPFRVELTNVSDYQYGTECDVTFMPLEDGEAHDVEVWLAVTPYDYVANQEILDGFTVPRSVGYRVYDRLRLPGERFDDDYGMTS